MLRAIRNIFSAVEVFERKGDIAEGDFYGFRFELRPVFFTVDELGLLGCEVERQKDSRIRGPEEGRQFLGRGREEDGEGACGRLGRLRLGIG